MKRKTTKTITHQRKRGVHVSAQTKGVLIGLSYLVVFLLGVWVAK